MGRFIRRLFILLIFLTIAFFVYRYINPDGASRLVDKIKSIPDNFGNFNLGTGSEDDINISGTTLLITGDIVVSEGDDEDMSWLEQLNQEIENILGTGEEGDVEEDDFDEEELDMTGSVEEDSVDTGVVVNTDEEETEIEDEEENTDNSGGDKTSQGLTSTDYQQMEDVFGNLVE